jgi:surfactin family lipopeptide synthetase C
MKIEDIYPLSPLQAGMMYHSVSAGAQQVFVNQIVAQLVGVLNIEAMRKAWQTVIDRHPVLRTAFVWEDVEEFLQIVYDHVPVSMKEQDWRGLSHEEQQRQINKFLHADREAGFKLDRPPLLRFALLRLAEDRYKFVWTHHHLILDGWSGTLVLNEVSALYDAFYNSREVVLPKPAPYRDYIAWVTRQKITDAELYWRRTLQGCQAPLRPLSPSPEDTSLRDHYEKSEVRLSEQIKLALQQICQQQCLTMNTLFQGAWALTLAAQTGLREVVFGCTFSDRPSAISGIESMVGLFINTIPVCIRISPHALIADWLTKLQNQQAEARQYGYAPLYKIHKWSNLPSTTALFDTILVFENHPSEIDANSSDNQLSVAGVEASINEGSPLVLCVSPGKELLIHIRYQSNRFQLAEVRCFLEMMQTFLEVLVRDGIQQSLFQFQSNIRKQLRAGFMKMQPQAVICSA